MKMLLLVSGLIVGLVSCSGPSAEESAASKAPVLIAPPISALPVHQPLSVGKVDTVDHFFYSNQHYKQVGELNQLAMFRLDSGGVLDVCGKQVAGLHYKLGNTAQAFLAQNLKGTAGLNLGGVRIIDWSSDLRGDDDQFFFFRQGKLQKIREQNAPDLAKLRDTW